MTDLQWFGFVIVPGFVVIWGALLAWGGLAMIRVGDIRAKERERAQIARKEREARPAQ